MKTPINQGITSLNPIRGSSGLRVRRVFDVWRCLCTVGIVYYSIFEYFFLYAEYPVYQIE
jgi:hypothetical protein